MIKNILKKGIVNLNNYGNIILYQTKNTLYFEFHLKNFQPFSVHAIHIHEYGDTTDGCLSLGGHYNPTNSNHGSIISKERHLGDLFNNFYTDENGNLEFLWSTREINIKDIYGRSIVIHKNKDDLGIQKYEKLNDYELSLFCKERNYKNLNTRIEKINKLNSESLISGNAGIRITCGIIAYMKL